MDKREHETSDLALKTPQTDDYSEDPTFKKELDPVGYHRLFRFADTVDKILMVVGSIAAIAVGAALPAFALLWGNMTDVFQTSSSDPDEMVNAAKGVMFNFLEIGAAIFVSCWIMTACWMIAG